MRKKLQSTFTPLAACAWLLLGPAKPKEEITFSANTMYEVYDQYGNIVKRGFASRIDITDLKKDLYYLNYDSKLGETFLKR